MSVQRRRGLPITAYPRKLVTDSRGNEQYTEDRDNPIQTTAAAVPQRSSRAEVAGQQEIDVVRLMVSAEIENIGLWSVIVFRGDEWDVAAPPAYHHGTRRTRHYSIDIRRRP